jgi:hypothetical protein
MMKSLLRCTAILLSLAFTEPSLAKAPLRAEFQCASLEESLVLTCRVKLLRGQQGWSGAKLRVSADMPSMPMVHRIKPVMADALGDEAGLYRFKLQLDMRGRWLIRLDVLEPERAVLTEVMNLP